LRQTFGKQNQAVFLIAHS